MPDLEPYENSLSIDDLRFELRKVWDQQHAFSAALRSLPEVPEMPALRMLAEAAMNIRQPDIYEIGKSMQRRLGLDAIPPKTELECAAGLWNLIRAGVSAGRSDKR